MQLVSIGQLARMLGVAVVTLRRWHAAGYLEPACRTPGGHRRYDVLAAKRQVGLADDVDRRTIAYARVSSHDQAEHLQTQELRHCEAQDYGNADVITDLGSGMNYKKKGLQKLLAAILQGTVGRVVLVTRDRLLRFGSEMLFSICRFSQVEVEVLAADAACSREQQLTEDLVEILTVFSSRLYGSRSRKNMRAITPKPLL